jgi:flavin reductase (NADH)
MARHFAGMTGMTMEDRLASAAGKRRAGQPVLKGALASLEGEISQVQTIGSHLVYLVEISNITLSQQGHGLIYFKRRFHPVMMEMDVAA